MSDGNSLINLGELSKPATVLIEKISDAIGGIFRPYQIRRIALAENDAEIIKAEGRIKISDLERRALQRVIVEEANRQHNIESITQKALPDLTEQAKPQGIENDWITNFFDKCRLISDDDMQALWAKVLAGEANSPGKYSIRTINFLSTLDKSDAELFNILCSFIWTVNGIRLPLIYDYENEIYNRFGVNYASLKHMEEIGLISFEEDKESTYNISEFSQNVFALYDGCLLGIQFNHDKKCEMSIGVVLLTKIGSELANICKPEPKRDFKEYIVKKWHSLHYDVVELEHDDLESFSKKCDCNMKFSLASPIRVNNIQNVINAIGVTD